MDEADWINLTEAARRLGVSRTAIRQRIQRGTLPSMMDNHGRPLTRLQNGFATVHNGTFQNVVKETVAEKTEPLSGQSETVPVSAGVPLSLHREIVANLQANHDAAFERLERQADAAMAALRSDLEAERLRHAAELSRLERAYRAGTEALMNRVAGLLVERRERRPWWALWFGASKRSKIGGA